MGTLNGSRYAIYARFSSDKQSDASIEDQVHRARAFIATEGGTLDSSLVFADFAVSGASMDRPGMRALEDAIRARKFDVLVTESVDRLSRDVEDAARFRKLLAHNTVDLGCLDGTRLTAAGKSDALMFGMRALFAEQYRMDLADKTRRGLEGRARKGAPTGAVPYGFRIRTEGETKTIEIHPDQAAVVRRIFTAYLSGRSFASIANDLNASNVAAPRSRPGREGLGWAHSAVRSMLLNESYTGRWTYGAREWTKMPGTNTRRPRARVGGALTVREAPELAIIDREAYERVLATFERRKTVPRANRAWLLSGLLRCSACGSKMYTTGPGTHRYYMCSAAKNGRKCSSRKNVPAHVAEDLVLEHTRETLDGAVEEVLEILNEEIRTWAAGRPDHAATIRKDIDRRTKHIAAAVDQLLESPSPAVRERLRVLESEQTAAVAELASFAAEVPVLPTAQQLRERIMRMTDVRNTPTEVAREKLRSLTLDGSIYCTPAADGSFRLRWTLPTERLFQAENENPAASGLEAEKGGGTIRTPMVAGAGFEPTTFGL
ncbi:MAG: recombinase [Myxococcaceae bacterium]|nr:recombinase [Myxococcaceae bacterium]